MKIKRIIPCLTVYNNKLIKTINFNLSNYTYLGDVLNAVRIFNENHAEELIIQDIGATINKSNPDFNLIRKISNISRMPICYGGGIKTLEQAKEILAFGIEKISISSAALNDVNFLRKLSLEIGKQSVSLTIDIKKIYKEYKICINNGKTKTQWEPLDFVKEIKNSIGELIINNIDKDGTMSGPDEEFVSRIYDYLDIPLVIMGGFGKIEHVSEIFNNFDLIGVACGSLFVFKGKNKAVLINYPKKEILNTVHLD